MPGLRALNPISSNITRPEKHVNPAPAAGSLQGPNPLFAILCAGLACGVLDITAALVVYGHYGRTPMRLLQGIAAGLLGPRSFEGGIATALLGLFCQFFIAFCAATIYFTATRSVTFLLEHAATSGVLYGITVYFFMNRIVVPLCGATKSPFSFKMMAIGIVIHIFCVGLPIAIIVRRFSMN
jgi:hypothetical protein